MIKVKDSWWYKVPVLKDKVRKLYSKLAAEGRKNLVDACYTKMVEERNWAASEPQIKNTLPQVILEHEMFYVPKGFEPGPMFVLPMFDLNHEPIKAQTKPLYRLANSDSKYWVIGDKEAFLGPTWLGTSDEMLARIIDKKYVVIVEGTFDFVAVRALAPDLPVLCSLTKKIGRAHEAYLRLLGVEHIYLMFDSDATGIQAMDIIERTYKHIKVEQVRTPFKDASKALEARGTMLKLREILNNLASQQDQSISESKLVILEEEE